MTVVATEASYFKIRWTTFLHKHKKSVTVGKCANNHLLGGGQNDCYLLLYYFRGEKIFQTLRLSLLQSPAFTGENESFMITLIVTDKAIFLNHMLFYR